MKTGTYTRQSGFTLIELAVVSVGMTLIALAVMNPALHQYREKKAEVAAVRMATFAQAAQAFRIDRGAWPDEANNCANPNTPMRTQGYIGTLNLTSPYNTLFTFSCTAGSNVFRVTVDTNSADWAQYIAGIIPAAEYTNGQDTVRLAASITAPVFENVLHRVAVGGRPELNRMQTHLDMNGNNINSVNQITAATGAITTLNSSTINNSGTVTTNALRWANQAELSNNQGGSIELGGRDGVAGTGTPFIDFHNGAMGVQDFNVRIINSANGILELIANNRVQVTGNLNASGTITAAQDVVVGSSRLTKAVQDLRVVENGNAIPKPVCPTGMVPGVVFAAETMAEGPTPNAYYGFSAWATDAGSQWTANVRVFNANGAVTPMPSYGRVAAFTFCY